MKKILCSLVAVLCLYSIIQLGKAFSSDIPNFDEENNVVSEETENKESEVISEIEEDSEKVDTESKEQKQEENNSQNNSKEPEIINNADENKKNEEIVKEEPQVTTDLPKAPDNVSPVEKETPKEIPVAEKETPKEVPVVEQSKTAWEELGISEDEYYRSPVWKWQEVMFGIYLSGDNYCSNATECREKCIAYGDAYISEHTGTYRCTTVNSYSGDYLGEDFDYKLLQP